MRFPLLFIIVFLIVGVLILVEQFVNYGVFFQVEDIHHETFAIASFAIALGIMIGAELKKKYLAAAMK